MADRYPDPFEDDEDFPDEELKPPSRDESSFAHRVIPDVVRRALMTGVGAALLGEEGIRNTLGEMKMPKEAMAYLVGQADRTKREAINSLARELRGFLDSLDLQGLLEKSLAGTTIEIQTTVRVIPKDGGGVGLEVMDNHSRVARDGEDDEEPSPKKRRGRSKSQKKGSGEDQA
jgi:hypothetical protein